MIITVGETSYGIGIPEALIILVIFSIAVGIPLGVTLLLRKVNPNKTWIGILLSFIFCPFGQFYLKGAWVFFLILILINTLLLVYFLDYGWFIAAILSAGIMYFRLKSLKLEDSFS